MLGKLLKYEWKATSRIMLPLYGAMLVLAALANLSMHLFRSDTLPFFNFISPFLSAIFFIVIFTTGVLCFATMIGRFGKNLMGDEGYLMFTLPVSTSTNILSKLISSVFWFFSGIIMSILSIFIFSLGFSYIKDIRGVWQTICTHISPEIRSMLPLYTAELIAAILIGIASTALLFYACISLGHCFPIGTRSSGFLFFIGIMIVNNIIDNIISLIMRAIHWDIISSNMMPIEIFHYTVLSCTLYFLFWGTIYFIVTNTVLQKRLNLE